MSLLKSDHPELPQDKSKDQVCEECGKSFSKSSSFYNHRKLTHGYKPAKENERGRPIKSESKPFDRVLQEILETPRKAMQDKIFPELAKILLKIVRKEKEFYDKVFDSMEKFEKDFDEFVKRTDLNYEKYTTFEYLKPEPSNNSDIKRFFKILLDNWRLTLKLTDNFCKELAIIIGYFLENCKKNKEELIQGIKEKLDLKIIINEELNTVGGIDFISCFIDILLNWKKNYKL